MVNNEISMPLERITDGAAAQSLASLAAAHVGITAGQSPLDVNQPAFVMTHIDLDFTMEFNQVAERNLRESSGPLLVLTNGNQSVANIAARFDGTDIWDATPASGTQGLAEIQELQRRIIRIVHPIVLPTTHELASAVNGRLVQYRYNGSPLRKGVKWVFPENVGWRWSWYNHTGGVVDDSALVNGYARYQGKWTK